MPNKDEKNKDYSKISMRIGDVHVEFEGTSENIKKLMADKEMFDFAKTLEANAKKASPESAPKTTPKTVSKEKTVQPPIKAETMPETPKKDNVTLGKKAEKPRKKGTNWRNVATALMIVSIILVASVVSVIAFYMPTVDTLNAQVAEKDASIADLSENATSLAHQVSALQSSITSYTSTISDLREVNELLNNQIASYLLMNTTTYIYSGEALTQNASESTMIFQGLLDYAGYVGVSVESTSNTTYVKLYYDYKTVTFHQNVTTAASGTAYFPVLPTGITINVGNTDTYTGDTVNATVSLVYYH
jgi:hypothetical protein